MPPDVAPVPGSTARTVNPSASPSSPASPLSPPTPSPAAPPCLPALSARRQQEAGAGFGEHHAPPAGRESGVEGEEDAAGGEHAEHRGARPEAARAQHRPRPAVLQPGGREGAGDLPGAAAELAVAPLAVPL